MDRKQIMLNKLLSHKEEVMSLVNSQTSHLNQYYRADIWRMLEAEIVKESEYIEIMGFAHDVLSKYNKTYFKRLERLQELHDKFLNIQVRAILLCEYFEGMNEGWHKEALELFLCSGVKVVDIRKEIPNTPYPDIISALNRHINAMVTLYERDRQTLDQFYNIDVLVNYLIPLAANEVDRDAILQAALLEIHHALKNDYDQDRESLMLTIALRNVGNYYSG